MPNMVKLAQLEVVERSEKLNFGIIKKDAEEEDDTFSGSKMSNLKQ